MPTSIPLSCAEYLHVAENGTERQQTPDVETCWAMQVDELRKLNKRLELTQLLAQASKQTLEERTQRLEADNHWLRGEKQRLLDQIANLENRQFALRYRVVDKAWRLLVRFPLLAPALRGMARFCRRGRTQDA